MKSQKTRIGLKLPSYNEYNTAMRKHRQVGAAMKVEVESSIAWYLKKLQRVSRPVHVTFVWHEENRKRDKDNVAFAKKFIFDALVTAGVLPDDGWRWVDGFADKFEVDREDPGVTIIIEEIE